MWLHEGRLWKHSGSRGVQPQTCADSLHSHHHEAGTGEDAAGWNTGAAGPDWTSRGPSRVWGSGWGPEDAQRTRQDLPLWVHHGGRLSSSHHARHSLLSLYPWAFGGRGKQLQQRHDGVVMLLLRLWPMSECKSESLWGGWRVAVHPQHLWR